MTKKDYEKKVPGNGVIYHYFYEYDHSEPKVQKHIPHPLKREWLRYTANDRHVYIENEARRYTEIIDASVIKKAGRPKGSKDSEKRTRRTYLKILEDGLKKSKFTDEEIEIINKIFEEE